MRRGRDAMKQSIIGILLAVLAVTACGPRPEQATATVAAGAAATLTALPTYTPAFTYTPEATLLPNPTDTPAPTYVPEPTYPAEPSPTALEPDHANIFCQYGFCIGIPEEAFLVELHDFEPNEIQDMTFLIDEESERDKGELIGENTDEDFFMQLFWDKTSPSTWKPVDALGDFIYDLLDRDSEPVAGSMAGYEVTYTVLPLDDDPYGEATGAVWYCNGRGFHVLFKSEHGGLGMELLAHSLANFTCGR